MLTLAAQRQGGGREEGSKKEGRLVYHDWRQRLGLNRRHVSIAQDFTNGALRHVRDG